MPVCLSTGDTTLKDSTSEDCLFLDVFAPTNATSTSGLPVYVFIQGGGFNSNANAKLNGTGLVEASDMDMVVVTFNYRVGPYGFLASQEVIADGNLNVGLKDQRKVFQWVQKHISQVRDCYTELTGVSLTEGLVWWRSRTRHYWRRFCGCRFCGPSSHGIWRSR